jgi:hypothetical protein
MKAIAVHPGKAHSIHLRDVPEPRLEDVPDGRGVLVGVEVLTRTPSLPELETSADLRRPAIVEL